LKDSKLNQTTISKQAWSFVSFNTKQKQTIIEPKI